MSRPKASNRDEGVAPTRIVSALQRSSLNSCKFCKVCDRHFLIIVGMYYLQQFLCTVLGRLYMI